jgi:hypothetical protein
VGVVTVVICRRRGLLLLRISCWRALPLIDAGGQSQSWGGLMGPYPILPFPREKPKKSRGLDTTSPIQHAARNTLSGAYTRFVCSPFSTPNEREAIVYKKTK